MFAFVRPCSQLNRYIQNVPLNYIHLAGWLRRAGREVHILDMVLDSVTPAYVDEFIREHRIRVVGKIGLFKYLWFVWTLVSRLEYRKNISIV